MKFLVALATFMSVSLGFAQTVETIPSSPLTEERPGRISLYVQNTCYTDVMLAVRYLNIRNQAESRGFYRLYPGQVTYITEMKSRDYLLYATTVDRRVVWRGPYPLPLGGVHYPAMKIRLPGNSGAWTTILYCR